MEFVFMDWYEWTATQQSACACRTPCRSNKYEPCSEHPSMYKCCGSVREMSSVQARHHQSSKVLSYDTHSRISTSKLGRCWICHRFGLKQPSVYLSSVGHIHLGERWRESVYRMQNTVQMEMECTIVQTWFPLYGTSMYRTRLVEVPLHCCSEHTWYGHPPSSMTCSYTTASIHSLRRHCSRIVGDSVGCHSVLQKKER